MEQEWDRLEQKRSNEELDAMLHVMEEMQNEKRLEEQQMLRQYEERLQFEEDRFSACIECFLADDVICPICKRNPLQQDKQVIFCFCGMRVDTKNHAVTLDFVKNQLKDAMEQHGKMNECCFGEALFSVSSYPEYDISNLIMACTGCDFLAVVL
ncbi:RPA-interacting protein A-like isoform X2 [Dendronephthya gigantea]|nr:RPA-interacting protein A-like isoform X2 [Dendronephthya gigantea]XP_028400321.1 RPA-interacting protein A-like isoform X2 [Dendronephthya gigantea]XP_028400322.1 RPA-interacting protein A-like isoform X2 [Dendronephthya gigantea]